MWKIFRTPWNLSQDRWDVEEGEMTLEEVKDLILNSHPKYMAPEYKEKDRPGEPVTRLKYTDSSRQSYHLKIAPIWTLQLLENRFSLEDGVYRNITFRSYSGSKSEMHYIELERGLIEAKFNGGSEDMVLKRKPSRTASLELLTYQNSYKDKKIERPPFRRLEVGSLGVPTVWPSGLEHEIKMIEIDQS